MQNIRIRALEKTETETALSLVQAVFMQYEAPDDTPEGVQEFDKSIRDDAFLSRLTFCGAWRGDEPAGVIATRNEGKHIALFFVDGNYHRQGIGRMLFEAVRTEHMTVNSSPFAVPVYRKLGFHPVSTEMCVNGLRFTPMEF